MRIRLGQLKQVIREVASERRASLTEVDRKRLVGMYQQLGQRIKKITPQTDHSEHQQIVQAIRDIAAMDMGMGDRLLAFYKKHKHKADTMWDHVPMRRGAA